MKKLIMKMKQKRGKESAFTLIEMAVTKIIQKFQAILTDESVTETFLMRKSTARLLSASLK